MQLSRGEVADAVALGRSAITRLVTHLEGRGLLMRCLCPTDRRGPAARALVRVVEDAGVPMEPPAA
ncbi:MarR family transcriptional regulator [Streptomyces sp. NPDC088090]|uniref:MarR family transcriptional regulator n=1 Tax=Streptomyces sp. NPDC088090 TaxID=3365822 RepID=UPI00384FA342